MENGSFIKSLCHKRDVYSGETLYKSAKSEGEDSKSKLKTQKWSENHSEQGWSKELALSEENPAEEEGRREVEGHWQKGSW